MSAGKRYVLDANVFIGAQQKYYSQEICPGFWRALIREHEEKRICSIDKVKAEVVTGNDPLSIWARDTAPTTFFKGTADKAVIDAIQDMVRWVQSEQQFNAGAKAEFASVADGWVVAYAKVSGLVVVTHEEYAPDAKKKVPIPNVCLEYDVEYCNTFEMLRDLGIQFLLKKRRTGD